MTWDGITCAGTASTYTHEQALQLAAAQASSTGKAWRLPNIKELSSIVDRNLHNPAFDPTAFPATPESDFWSASPFFPDSHLFISLLRQFCTWVSMTPTVLSIVCDIYVRLVRDGP